MGYVPSSMGGTYPGLYLSTSPSRFVRPVKNISVSFEANQNIELIGPFEQVSSGFLFTLLPWSSDAPFLMEDFGTKF